jgi:hypothetical protein
MVFDPLQSGIFIIASVEPAVSIFRIEEYEISGCLILLFQSIRKEPWYLSTLKVEAAGPPASYTTRQQSGMCAGAFAVP